MLITYLIILLFPQQRVILKLQQHAVLQHRLAEKHANGQMSVMASIKLKEDNFVFI